MKKNFSIVLATFLFTLPIAYGNETPFQAFEGSYRVTSEQCFSETYLHPAMCRPSLIGIKVTLS
ncbi:MAG: hypothetical protein ABI041_08330, partial [Bdellovibrionia bacterium]